MAAHQAKRPDDGVSLIMKVSIGFHLTPGKIAAIVAATIMIIPPLVQYLLPL